MTKTELESKHLAELHELAADAGVERYRMLPRAELIEKLAGGEPGGASQSEPKPKRERKPRERKPRQPRDGGRREQKAEPKEAEAEIEEKPEPAPLTASATPAASSGRPKRKRRRRWGRRPKGIRVHDLLLPATGNRQTIVYAESRAACTALLREVASELSGASDGPDPIALLVDPSPEELAEWKRDAPEAEIVSAGKAKHADDALAQANIRAAAGEDVIVLIDSLSRYAEDFAGPDEARALFDAGVNAGVEEGSLTVVAALERPA